jgi:hypothetical protein
LFDRYQGKLGHLLSLDDPDDDIEGARWIGF